MRMAGDSTVSARRTGAASPSQNAKDEESDELLSDSARSRRESNGDTAGSGLGPAEAPERCPSSSCSIPSLTAELVAARLAALSNFSQPSETSKAPSNASGDVQAQSQTVAQAAVDVAGPICANCSTQTTSLWRRSPEGQTLCNACSLYQKMKGCPRPVSLKTNVIKHRNRSKGEKKLKEAGIGGGASSGGKGKGAKKSRAASVASTSTTKQGSPVMEDVEEDVMGEGMDELDDSTSQAGGDVSMSASKRPRTSMEGNPSVAARQQQQTASRTREYQAAATLAQAGNAASAARRSVSVDGRLTPTSNTAAQHLPYNLASLFSGFISREMGPPAGGASLSGMNGLKAASGAQSLYGQHHLLPQYVQQHQAQMQQAAAQQAAAQVAAAQTLQQQRQQRNGKDASSGIVSRTDPRSYSSTPSDTPQRSPLFTNPIFGQYAASGSGRSSPGSGNTSGLGKVAEHDTKASLTDQASVPNSEPRLPSMVQTQQQLPSHHPLRSFSTDRFAGRHWANGDYGVKSGKDALSSSSSRMSSESGTMKMDEERERQRASFEEFLQQRSSEAGASGRAAALHSHTTNVNSFRPYDLTAHRSQSRSGNYSESRLASSAASRPSPTQSTSQTLPRAANGNGRPGSSASSSSGSNEALPKRLSAITSPPLHSQPSPPLPTTSMQGDGMAIDEPDHSRTNMSPPFLPRLYGMSTASERRGRSTTRRARDSEEAVAHGFEALRMRDTSRGSSYVGSPSPPPSSTTANYPQSIYRLPPASSIKTADLDDGIVRDAMTHRPISDMRGPSGSPPTTLPSLSSALSSTASSRSLSGARGGRSGSRQSSRSRLPAVPASSSSCTTPHQEYSNRLSRPSSPPHSAPISNMLPPPNSGFEEVQRLRTRIQELEFINSLMEGRVAELEQTARQTGPPHGSACGCKCSEIAAETQANARALESLKHELSQNGITGLPEDANRGLLELLTHKLGYRAGDLSRPPSA